MSAGLAGIGPVSVRYAMQIKQLLDVQAIKRMAAEQEAARADAAAERAARVEAIRNASTAYEPVKVDVKSDVEARPAVEKSEAAPAREPVAPVETVATADIASAQFVDEMA